MKPNIFAVQRCTEQRVQQHTQKFGSPFRVKTRPPGHSIIVGVTMGIFWGKNLSPSDRLIKRLSKLFGAPAFDMMIVVKRLLSSAKKKRKQLTSQSGPLGRLFMIEYEVDGFDHLEMDFELKF